MSTETLNDEHIEQIEAARTHHQEKWQRTADDVNGQLPLSWHVTSAMTTPESVMLREAERDDAAFNRQKETTLPEQK